MNAGGIFNNYSLRRELLTQLIASIRQRPLLCLGLMLYWIWINISLQSPLLYPLVKLSPTLTVPSIVGPIAASILAYFVLGIWFKRSNVVFRQRWYIALLAGLMALGVIANVFWLELTWPTALLDAQIFANVPSAITAGGIALYVTGSLCVGVPTACLCIEWGRIFGEHGPRQVLFHGIVAFLGAALCATLISRLPPLACSIAALLLAAPMAWCVIHSQREFPRKSFFDHGLDAALHIPGKFLITALLHGLSFGILLGLFSVQGHAENTILLVSYALAAVLLLVTAVAVMMDFNHLIYQIGFSLVACGSMLIAFFYPAFSWGSSLQLMGFCYLHLLMWGLCSYLIKNFKLPATWVVAWPTGSFMLGQMVGIATGSLVFPFPDTTQTFTRLFLLLTFVMLVAGLFLMSYRNYQTAWGLARPGSPTPHNNELATVVQLLATTNELSARETQTLELLARGKNRKAIGQTLFISEETVKSHAHSIYRKLAVHSQQELIRVCEQRAFQMRDRQSPAFGVAEPAQGFVSERAPGPVPGRILSSTRRKSSASASASISAQASTPSATRRTPSATRRTPHASTAADSPPPSAARRKSSASSSASISAQTSASAPKKDTLRR
ncbi:MAG: helix-turn-helix transcriptional regulator [Coriobacteriales bacterium]|jgi:DNA-binding CsgD family transcriptional regulator|nr:helix-turn-helix transcriptional regulator [Coriobacteriales bacterium]